jgi:hypothetical protein
MVVWGGGRRRRRKWEVVEVEMERGSRLVPAPRVTRMLE